MNITLNFDFVIDTNIDELKNLIKQYEEVKDRFVKYKIDCDTITGFLELTRLFNSLDEQITNFKLVTNVDSSNEKTSLMLNRKK